MSALPNPSPVTKPTEVTRAMAGLAEIQVAVAETFCVVPSSKLPVATNWWELASGTVEFAGVTASETRFAFVTVNVAGELAADPMAAVMLVVPAEIPKARPCVPGELLMVAADCEGFHGKRGVMSSCVPSL